MHTRRILLSAAESHAAKGAFGKAARRAEDAFEVAEAPPEPDDLERMHRLLLAGNSAMVAQVRELVEEFDLSLPSQAAEARRDLRATEQVTGSSISRHVPGSAASFVGRLPELAGIYRSLDDADGRLLTLKGPGGVGKSRLALEVARQQRESGRFPHGIFVVPLESLVSPGLIPNAIAGALGLDTPGPARALRRIVDHVGDRHVLLVLDNFEHLMSGAELVAELIAACPNLRILVTSRERLNLAQERVMPVGGLPFPEDGALTVDEAGELAAVSLYVQRARRANPGFELDDETLPDVLETCRLVEGLPLGIELAATWLRVLPPDEVAAEIARSPSFLVARDRNVPDRHQSLRRAFDHSWRLLRPEEQRVLRGLAVFRGGFRRSAAGEVAEATIPVLASLVEKSLLRIDQGGRYDRHPLLYQFTIEKLAAHPDEKATARLRHGRYFLAFLASFEDSLVGRD